MITRKLILFLIRRLLGVRKFECFKFTNQKEECMYFFNHIRLIKITEDGTKLLKVSLNWLLSPKCEIEKC